MIPVREKSTVLVCVVLLGTTLAFASEERSKITSARFDGLSLRSIGPALSSGRVVDIAVHPKRPKV